MANSLEAIARVPKMVVFDLGTLLANISYRSLAYNCIVLLLHYGTEIQVKVKNVHMTSKLKNVVWF